MKQIEVKGIRIGDGIVKACMSISGASETALVDEARYAGASSCDIVEWRADLFLEELSESVLERLLTVIHSSLAGKPLLLTVRTEGPGGERSFTELSYFDLCKRAIASKRIDLIDLEFSKDPKCIEELLRAARSHNIITILSSHIYGEMPERSFLLSRLSAMQETCADIVKLAVVANSEKDADIIISAGREMYEKLAVSPFVLIGMGEEGRKTRLAEPFYGSSITYVRGKKETAAGQLSIEELRGQATCGSPHFKV